MDSSRSALWCVLLFGTIIGLMRLARMGSSSSDLGWVRNYSQMLGASLVAYATGSMFLGLSYWDILYQIIVIAVLLAAIAKKVRAANGDAAESPATVRFAPTRFPRVESFGASRS